MTEAQAGAGLGAFRVLVEGLDHPEGLCLSPDGHIYAGGEAGQVYRLHPAGGEVTEVGRTGGFLLGLTADGSGRLYLCDTGRRELLRCDPRTAEVEVISAGLEERPMINPNWAAFDADGNLYLTDSGHWDADDGWIWRLDRRGELTVWTEASRAFPNGCCLDASGDWLYVCESTAPALVRLPIAGDGSAGTREVVAELPGTVPDGVSLDMAGNAYVCCYRPDVILRVAPDGTVAEVASDPRGTLLSAPTNGIFCGEGLRQFVCGSLGRWHLATADLGVAGLPLHYPRVDY